ncbi:MAG: amidase [Acidobacteria bacterium]|nr:amidase [Acidobacteriota bacterium]
MENAIHAPAAALARAIRAREISSEEIVNACLARIETVNGRINAAVRVRAEEARREAREADAALTRGAVKGPLHGVPVTIKDSFDLAGVVAACGTRGRSSYVPRQDATTVARLRAAGAVVLAKTNAPEFCLAYETDNLVYGRTNNPYDAGRTPGGSSGGEAALIAAGGSPLGLGSDMGGSIRLPAHFCGICGLKPTAGRVPRTGHFPPAGGPLDALIQIGPLARFVEDLRLALPVLSGPDWRDPAIVPMPLADAAVPLKDLRIAFHTDNGICPPTPETADVVRQAAKALESAGAIVEENRPEGMEQAMGMFTGLMGADGGAAIQMLLLLSGTAEPHPFTRALLAEAGRQPLSTREFEMLLFRLDVYRGAMLGFLENYDAILCPACAQPAMPHGTTFENLPAFSYTLTYNVTGWPAAVVRGGTSPDGLPIGVQAVARPWREDVALAMAAHLETALGGWQTPTEAGTNARAAD